MVQTDNWITGLAMGKSYSPVVADLYLGHWESGIQQLASTCGGKVYKFWRYADDYLVLFQGSDGDIKEWVDCLTLAGPIVFVLYCIVLTS